jgi:hypothetical protein
LLYRSSSSVKVRCCASGFSKNRPSMIWTFDLPPENYTIGLEVHLC